MGSTAPSSAALKMTAQERGIGPKPFYQEAMEKYPGYESWLDPQTGMMKKQFQLTPSDVWGKTMRERQALESQQAGDIATQQRAGQLGQAQSALAMGGGITGGAAERLGQASIRQGALGAQEQARQDMLARLGITGEEEQRKQDIEKFNIGQAMGEKRFATGAELEKYKALMAAMGAERTAQAEEAPGK